MNTPPNHRHRILVVGRSPGVLVEAVEILRAKGYSADATNQFDQVLDDYDVTDLDLLVFGGMIPADTKQQLREAISERNPRVTFVQGLAGIAGLIAAQVESETSAGADTAEVSYQVIDRSVHLSLDQTSEVTITAWWATSFVPPEPKSTSMLVWEGELSAGSHAIPLPERIPSQASFVAVTVGSSVHVLTVGPMPKAVMRMVPKSATDQRLPEVSKVTTTGVDR
ncbi:MAG TPA: hypothetical protein VIP98_13720 [Microlunatus sp.]